MRFAVVLVVGAVLAAWGGSHADTTRSVRNIDQALLLVPDAGQLDIASLGFEEAVADLLWIRAVLTFGERFEKDRSDAWTEWMVRMIDAVNTLDPRWRTAYFYGGTLLRVMGDVEASDRVFLRAIEALPEDYYFPFALGMNAYLYREDLAEAARWLDKAAMLPDAPAWYQSAAAAMRADSGDLDGAIRELEETLRDSERPELRADAEHQLGRLRQRQLVNSWRELCREFRSRTGRPLSSPEELERLLDRPLPPSPRGDRWLVGADGVVRSEGAERDRLRRMRIVEMHLAGAR